MLNKIQLIWNSDILLSFCFKKLKKYIFIKIIFSYNNHIETIILYKY